MAFSALGVAAGIFGAFATHHLPANSHTAPAMQAMLPGVMAFIAVICLAFLGFYGWILVVLFKKKIREEFKPKKQQD